MSIIPQTHKYIMQKTYKLSYITLYVIELIIRVDMYWNGSALHAACSCMAPGHACYRMTDVGRMLLNWGSVTVAKSESPELCQFSFTETTSKYQLLLTDLHAIKYRNFSEAWAHLPLQHIHKLKRGN